MTVPIREPSTVDVDSTLLSGLGELARGDGAEVDRLVDEALSDFIEKKRKSEARPHVVAAYQRSRERFASLYQKLAK